MVNKCKTTVLKSILLSYISSVLFVCPFTAPSTPSPFRRPRPSAPLYTHCFISCILYLSLLSHSAPRLSVNTTSPSYVSLFIYALPTDGPPHMTIVSRFTVIYSNQYDQQIITAHKLKTLHLPPSLSTSFYLTLLPSHSLSLLLSQLLSVMSWISRITLYSKL